MTHGCVHWISGKVQAKFSSVLVNKLKGFLQISWQFWQPNIDCLVNEAFGEDVRVFLGVNVF